MTWETVIGLEIHVQLSAESKIFSPASTVFCNAANTQVREVDCGFPGALPVLNRRVVDCAILLGTAISATVNQRSEFARKNYFYPDLPKGYQISQFEYPIVEHGEMWINGSQGEMRIGVTRAHLEEDAGKLIHDHWATSSGVDLNRAGTPLLEIVSEPDLRDINDAVLYASEMHKLVRWLGICDGNMQEGSFRIDANISVRHPGDELGTRCEIKNLNSFRFLEQALHYERERQINLIEDGGTVVQQTRLFNTASGETRAMRSKEDAHDYRYFPDPDLPPLLVDDAWIAEVCATMPELPRARAQRFINDYQLSPYDATLLTADKDFSDYYETLLAQLATDSEQRNQHAKLCANWLCGDFAALLNEHKIEISASKIDIAAFADLMRCLINDTISGKIAKTVLLKMWDSGEHASIIIEREGLMQISDSSALEKIGNDIIAANAQQAQQYRDGKDRLLGFFVGQMMKATKGQANPEQANEIMKRLLAQ